MLLFVTAIMASAFLIFFVQPMVGKRILPWFGGAPSVWALCLAFYQTTLFLGYAYAHLLIRFASPALQLGIHLLAAGAALVVLPVLPSDAWQPTGATHPSVDIISMLASNVALPFLVLAATGPLVQAWFARRFPERSPYPLYAVSNVGAFAALLTYPFLIEPRLPLSTTGTLWSYFFAATAAAVLGCAIVALFSQSGAEPEDASGTADGPPRLRGLHVSLWLLLAGCAVLLLMGVTNSVCLDVASVPFLWVLPLATYLLTFILCFASERVYRPIPYVIVTIIASFLTLGLPLLDAMNVKLGGAPQVAYVHSMYVQIPAYCVLLFGGCMIMHGELYRLRPPPRALTAFYLCVSGGGALGGLFVGVLAPIWFDDYYEVRVGLGLAALLLVAASAHRNRVSIRAGVHRWRFTVAAPLALLLVLYGLWPGDVVGDALLHQERSFFGVLRVVEVGEEGRRQRRMSNGSTLHGVQFQNPDISQTPSSYYGKATGIGVALAERQENTPRRIGVIGLGVGTLSAYGRKGDHFRYYEIDPVVVHLARDAGYFSFLGESLAESKIILGDARLAIADEQKHGGSQAFDYLILDAFSSDAIPVHMLTLEAFRYYAEALAPDGVLAVHVTSGYFDLMPLVARAGFEVGLETLKIRSRTHPRYRSLKADWVLLTSSHARMEALFTFVVKKFVSMNVPPEHAKLERPSEAEVRAAPLWTDDYSDLLGALVSR